MVSKKSVIWVVVLLAVLFFLTSGGLIADEIPDFIELNKDASQYNWKGPVPFEHAMHAEDYGVSCNECHHVYIDGTNVWKEGDPVQKCAACHDPSKNKGDIKKLRLAFHKLCKGCHRQLKKEGISDEAPYRTCRDCHKEKS